MIPHDEAPSHEFEAAHGLPQPLPRGERMLWQGSPDWRVLAREAMHLRFFAGYFALLLGWRAATVLAEGSGLVGAARAVALLLPMTALALGLIALLAWLVGRTSVYTITDRRVVLRIGVVLSITFNLPLSKIAAAGVRTGAEGHGDIALSLAGTDRIAYLHLWPHARPWRLKHAEPMLRALPEARVVAGLLSEALAASGSQPMPSAQATPPRAAAFPAGVVEVLDARSPKLGPAAQQPLAA